MYLKNESSTKGTSAGIDLNGLGGGEYGSFKRLSIVGFNVAIRTNGEGSNPGNGDKTIVEQARLEGAFGFDQTGNNQAYGWTFLNCAGSATEAQFKMSGAGETLIANFVGNPVKAFIKYPEGSGNAGSGGRPNYFGQRTTVMSTKLEYHGSQDRMLVDARESLLLTDSGGSNCDLVLREVSLASGAEWPDPQTHTVIQIGNGTNGSDAIRVKAEGGWIEGRVKIGSAQLVGQSRRWSFRDMARAPNPRTVDFLGSGSHYMIEWRANENVPVDQYRGGQAFVGSLDAQKQYIWGHLGPRLINTGISGAGIDYNNRYGANLFWPIFLLVVP